MNEIKDAFKRWSNFNGRSTRKQFWVFFLLYLVVSAIVNYFTKGENSLLAMLILVVILVPYFSVSVRRMHDINKKGWFILIPFYNLYLYTKEGDTHANRFGNPVGNTKAPEVTETVKTEEVKTTTE